MKDCGRDLQINVEKWKWSNGFERKRQLIFEGASSDLPCLFPRRVCDVFLNMLLVI